MSTWPPPGAFPLAAGPRRPPSAKGPTIALVVGALAAMAAVVVGALAFHRPQVALPTSVLAPDGSAGDGVVATAQVPGLSRAELVSDRAYDLYLVTDVGRHAELTSQVAVVDPEGTQMVVHPGPAGRVIEAGPTRAEALGRVFTDDTGRGDHGVLASSTTDGRDGTIYVVNARSLGTAGDTVIDTVGGFIAAFLLLGTALVLIAVGLSLLLAGRVRAAYGPPMAR